MSSRKLLCVKFTAMEYDYIHRLKSITDEGNDYDVLKSLKERANKWKIRLEPHSFIWDGLQPANNFCTRHCLILYIYLASINLNCERNYNDKWHSHTRVSNQSQSPGFLRSTCQFKVLLALVMTAKTLVTLVTIKVWLYDCISIIIMVMHIAAI